MKNALLALALFAFVGTATAHEGHNGDKAKKGKKRSLHFCHAGQLHTRQKDGFRRLLLHEERRQNRFSNSRARWRSREVAVKSAPVRRSALT